MPAQKAQPLTARRAQTREPTTEGGPPETKSADSTWSNVPSGEEVDKILGKSVEALHEAGVENIAELQNALNISLATVPNVTVETRTASPPIQLSAVPPAASSHMGACSTNGSSGSTTRQNSSPDPKAAARDTDMAQPSASAHQAKTATVQEEMWSWPPALRQVIEMTSRKMRRKGAKAESQWVCWFCWETCVFVYR